MERCLYHALYPLLYPSSKAPVTKSCMAQICGVQRKLLGMCEDPALIVAPVSQKSLRQI